MKVFTIFGLIGMSFLAGKAMADGWEHPRESFRESCVITFYSAAEIVADCKDIKGIYVHNDVNHLDCRGDIGNQNGRLVCDQRREIPRGSYFDSCTNIRMDQDGGLVLLASCKDRSGRYTDTSLPLGQCKDLTVGNMNGNLVCQGFNPR